MSYEVLAGEDRAYCLGEDVTPDQHAEELNAEIVDFKLHPEKCNGNKVTHYNIDLQIILRCFETGENDTLEPTAEWSRIQQTLKERDELVEELNRSIEIRNLLADKCRRSHSKTVELNNMTSERDELKAELERVKAERDEWQKTHEDHVWESIEHIDEMKKDRQSAIDQLIKAKEVLRKYRGEFQSLKSRLPVNRDGDSVSVDDEQFVMVIGGPAKVTVRGIMRQSDGLKLYIEHDKGTVGVMSFIEPEHCHSSAESCRAAHEGKEGDNDEK